MIELIKGAIMMLLAVVGIGIFYILSIAIPVGIIALAVKWVIN